MSRRDGICLACGLVAVALTAVQARAYTESVLHNFSSPPKGAGPWAGVIRGSGGALYGTTYWGGKYDFGVVFATNGTGKEKVIYNFTGGSDGAHPYAGVVRDSQGNFYGTTINGGTAGVGVVFKVSPAGQETVLHSFTGPDGNGPWGGVVLDAQGNLYGTTASGGPNLCGVVFKLTPAGEYSILHGFTNSPDGCQPIFAGVTLDAAGNLYGTTTYGGQGIGLVYKISQSGQETVLHTFTGSPDGSYPYGGVIADPAGNLYGTTSAGGTDNTGTVYELNPSGQETVLYNFTFGAGGIEPEAGVILDSAGNLYGTTFYGGNAGYGVVYELSAGGQETVLYSFTGGADGSEPISSLVRDMSGNLYGTTTRGGTGNLGVVFEVDSGGHETAIYSFPSTSGGASPYSGVTRDSSGNLYGTTFAGGTADFGTVYKIAPNGRQTVLFAFAGGTTGESPNGGVVLDGSGNLYGTTYSGGTSGAGVVYKVSPNGEETVLHSFAVTDGLGPTGEVIMDSSGNLYGTTQSGGEFFMGVAYKLSPAGQLTVLHSFAGGTADGASPYGGVILDSAGNLYGTTFLGGSGNAGTVFKITAAGQESVLYSFTGGADGGMPLGAVVQDSAGNLYGTCVTGGPFAWGVVFKLDPAGLETVLYGFRGEADGAAPQRGALTLDSSGNLYGTTQWGGAEYGSTGFGVVYQVSPAGQETVLYTFTGGTDGASPESGVTLDSAGNIYGTASLAGSQNEGVVFKLTP